MGFCEVGVGAAQGTGFGFPLFFVFAGGFDFRFGFGFQACAFFEFPVFFGKLDFGFGENWSFGGVGCLGYPQNRQDGEEGGEADEVGEALGGGAAARALGEFGMHRGLCRPAVGIALAVCVGSCVDCADAV